MHFMSHVQAARLLIRLKLNSTVEIQGRVGRFLKIKDKYKGKKVYVTGNHAYIRL